MSKQGKAWGETQEIFNNGIVSVNYLKINKGGFCSEHCHNKKRNIFFVIKGNLSIIIWRGEEMDETIVWAGESSIIEPGVYHQFRALTDVECFEIYEVDLKGQDIERRTTGGKK